MAADYRIRYYFANTVTEIPENLTARRGVDILYLFALPATQLGASEPSRWVWRTRVTSDNHTIEMGVPVPQSMEDEEVDKFFANVEILRESARKFFEDLDKDVRKIKPAGRRLPRDQEELLARYCYVLAIFDTFGYRLGKISLDSPLIYPEVKRTTGELLSIAEDAWIEDLCSLSWAFYDEGFPRELLSSPAVINPMFTEKGVGYNGDLIVDGCLVDVKTTVQPKLSREWIYQLLHYVLLDNEDRYSIREVGIYFTRQQELLRWPISDLLFALNGDAVPPLDKLRDDYAVALNKSARNS